MASSERLVRPLRRAQPLSVWWLGMLGSSMLAAAAVLAAQRGGVEDLAAWGLPAVIFVAALILVWSPLDGVVQADARRPDVVALFSGEEWLRVVTGLALSVVAIIWLAQWDFDEKPLVRAIAIPAIVIAAAGLILAPWWMRLMRQVGIEREQRVREFERAEIAAHLHDSVLQTLTLIRANAGDADKVARLARAQERDLRAYLYQDRRTPQASVATALSQAMAEVEDAHGVTIEVIHVGDTATGGSLRAAVDAAREAALNAARHGIGPVAVYAELTPSSYEIYVRDNGPGFDPAVVDSDRAGIRHSIIGRVSRHGGVATVNSAPGRPTEVAIAMPRKEQP